MKEDPVANYDGAVTGDAASGFTITNTNTETVDVQEEEPLTEEVQADEDAQATQVKTTKQASKKKAQADE